MKRGISAVLVSALVAVGVSGCASHTPPQDSSVARTDQPPPTPVKTVPAPTIDNAGATGNQQRTTEGTREQIAQRLACYGMDKLRVGVLSTEQLDQYGLGDEVAQRMRETFSELGMLVVNLGSQDRVPTGESEVRKLASDNDVDLPCIVQGSARERTNLHGFFSYEAEIRASMYEANGSLVATKELTSVGDRSFDQDKAAESALLTVSNQLSPFLLEQLTRKVGQNVVTRRLTVTGLPEDTQPMWITSYLSKQPGVNDVRLLSWRASSGEARYWVSVEPWAADQLGAYLIEVPHLDVRIVSVDQKKVEAENRR